MKKILTIVLILTSLSIIYAQNEIDAYRFSKFYPEGTARSISMGNAFGAIGSDLSAAYFNPAGIAIFDHSEITFTPSLLFHTNNASFNNTKVISNKTTFYVSNFAMVFPMNINNETVKNINFSFGYNRLNNYKEAIRVNGTNPNGSMLDYFMNSANGNTPNQLNQFNTFLAFDTWLIDTLPNTNARQYTNPLWFAASPNSPVYNQTVERYDIRRGGAGEYFLNAAVNIKDMLFAGVTIGLPSANYYHSITHKEFNFVDNTDLNSFTYTEVLDDKLSGINIKAGLIFQPLKFIRIGGSIASPTYYSISDKFYTSVESHWNTPDQEGKKDYYQNSPNNSFTYNLSTPAIYRANIGIIIAPVALIGVDYEFMDYSTMFMSADDYMFTKENSTIDTMFQGVNNIRGGVEFNLGIVRLRAGAEYLQNPYTHNNSKDRISLMGGFGFNTKNIYVDFAFKRYQNTSNYIMYNGYVNEEVPSINALLNTYTLTFGLKF